jgi:hypothetical protein
MAIAASAFPRLSPSGLRVVAGEKTIVIDQSIEVGAGLDGQWADETTIYYRRADGAFMSWGGTSVIVRQPGFNTYSTGGPGRWAGYNAARSAVEFDNGTIAPGWSGPALSTDPGVWAAIVHANGRIITGIGTPGRYASSSCRDLRFCGRALAWNVFLDGRWQIAGVRDLLKAPTETPALLSIEREEFWPVPLLINDVLWLMTHSHDRLLLRPWGSTDGYVVATGITNTPDAKQLPNGRVRVVWDAGRNVLGDALIDPSLPRVDLTAPAIPQPERLPEGTEIDLLPFLIGEASTWPRHGDHYMHQVWDGHRNLHFLKFGPIAEGSTQGDAWERLVLDGDQFYLREDRSQSGAGIYSFHPGTAYKRRMRVGQWINVPDNILQRYETGTCRVIDQHPLPYRLGLVEAWRHFDCGGDLGIRDVVKCSYDPGNLTDTIEHFWYAKGAGWFRWQEQRQDDPSRTHTTTFNRIGGQALTPTQGCWRRDLVPWPPDEPEPRPDPKPQEPPTDPVPHPGTRPMRKTVSLKSAINDRVVCADRNLPSPGPRGGICVRANRDNWDNPGPWEQAEVEFNTDGTVSFRTPISDTITALWSGDPELIGSNQYLLCANRPDQPDDQAGPAERWETVHVAEATKFNGTEVVKNAWAFKNVFNGKFLTVNPNDPEGKIYARGDAPNENELFYSTVSLIRGVGGGGGHVGGGPLGPSVITGRLRKEGRALADDAGYSLPVFCHSGTGIADLLYDEATERHNATLIKSFGFAGRRVWTRLRGTAPWSTNPKGWGGREFGHETMGDDAYRNLLITSFRQHQELGLKLALSAGDIEGIDNEHEIRKYVRLLGDALETVSPDGSLCSIFEPGNELPGIWRNGSPERSRDWILKPFKARFPSVLCTNSQGANESREERFRWCLDPADLDDIHSFRDNHWYDWIRHVINNAYVHEHGTQPREIIWGSEPFGTGRLVSVQPNIHEYDEHVAQISTIAHLMTGQIPCYFCSPGIRFDVARDMYGEGYEAMPGFATAASVAKLLPADIMTWPRENIVHGGREDPPGSPNPIFQEPGSGDIDRAYHVFSADHQRFAALIFGGESLDSRPYRSYHADVDRTFGNKARLVVGRVG